MYIFVYVLLKNKWSFKYDVTSLLILAYNYTLQFFLQHLVSLIDEALGAFEKVAGKLKASASENEIASDNLPADGAEWVDLFVREMTSATSVDDAKARAARILEVLEKSIRERASAEATHVIQKVCVYDRIINNTCVNHQSWALKILGSNYLLKNIVVVGTTENGNSLLRTLKIHLNNQFHIS